MVRSTIKLFKFNPDRREYWVGVVSKMGDKAFNVHDTVGVPHFMRYRDNEFSIELRHGNIPTNDGRVLAVQEMIRANPIGFRNQTQFLIDHRLHVKWVPATEISDTTPLDGSYTDSRGYRYFASTRNATEWMIAYLSPIVYKADAFLEKRTEDAKVAKEAEENKMAKLYAAANGDNYGEEFNVPVITHGPNTWWASLSQAERIKIYQEHAGDK